MKKYLDKRITLYLRGIKAIVIYHADEDYYALDLAGVVYSLKTKKDVESKFNEFVDRLIYKETLILKEILTDPDYQRRDFTMLDYFTALINREKAKSERSPESYMWDKVVRVYETKKSRKKIHDIKEQMELIWDEVHIIPKNIKKKEEVIKEEHPIMPELKIERPRKYDGIVITKDLDEVIKGFKYKYGLTPPVRVDGDSIIIDIGDNSLHIIPKYKLVNYVIPTHLTTINIVFVLGKDGDLKLQYTKLGKWVIK